MENKTQRHCSGHWEEKQRVLHGASSPRGSKGGHCWLHRLTFTRHPGPGHEPLCNPPSCGTSFCDPRIPERTSAVSATSQRRVCLLKIYVLFLLTLATFSYCLPPVFSRVFFVPHNISIKIFISLPFWTSGKEIALSLSQWIFKKTEVFITTYCRWN